ncbi:MAG: hypothetical protein ACK5QW_03980, partial [Cyanobacteriota bacterium]
DKNEVKIGDSIKKFGDRIAKAPLILAVISKKSLRSKWCMICEIYAAYERRGGASEEFGESVTALVLDDAQCDLDDEKALVEYWQAWCRDKEEILNVADPKFRKSLESRKLLNKCREMIESLPDMLLAINNIAMPRGSVEIRRDDFAEIIAYVQSKLPRAERDIPAPPQLDLVTLQGRLQHLSQRHAALTPPQLHASWHGAIAATWPLKSASILFPQLAAQAPLQWADLQRSLADAKQWNHLQMDRIELLFEHFTTRLEQAALAASQEARSPMSPSLSVLIKPTGDKSPEGKAAYRCKAVLSIPMAEGGWQYAQIEPAADHVFCFNPPADRPDWRRPGAVCGRLWQAAKARLMDLGRIDREPYLDLFLPRALLDEDWSRLELEDDSEDLGCMATIFYRLRSIDRWTNPNLLLHKEHFDRKHRSLAGGVGHWKLFHEHHPGDEIHKQLSLSRSPSHGQPETVAILRLGSLDVDFRGRETFYRSALESAAPVVLWWHPSIDVQAANKKAQHVAQLLKTLQLLKPTKTKNHSQEVRGNPFELSSKKQDLPSFLVVLIEDGLEMDPERPAIPRLIAVAEQAPPLGYGGSG